MKNNRKTICIVTGTRAEYGLLRSTMRAIQKNAGLKLQLLVTGMHLASEFGLTKTHITQDGFPIDAYVLMTPKGDMESDMAMSVGTGVLGITRALKKLCPEIVVILGDRVEAFAAAIATVYSGIYLAHIHGGDSAQAGLDESARHAITKLAHIHFPATQKSALRILKLGEESSHIFVVGAPGLDEVVAAKLSSRAMLIKKYNIDSSKHLLMVVQHSVSTQPQLASKQIRETLVAVAYFKYPTLLLYPNADAGGRAIIRAIVKFRVSHPYLQVHKSIPRSDYLGLLKIANVLIGNSSSGIIESPLFHIPVVNIGTRQQGREQSSNIISVSHDRKAIQDAIQKALFDKVFLKKVASCPNPYGTGHAGDTMARILSKIPLTPELLQKKLTY